jgi:hypothetical protein
MKPEAQRGTPVLAQIRECVPVGDLVNIAEQDEVVRGRLALQVGAQDCTLLVLPVPSLGRILIEGCYEMDDLVRPWKETLAVLLENEGLRLAGEGSVSLDEYEPVDEVSQLVQADFEQIQFVVEEEAIPDFSHDRR